ncbi:MAG: asparaginase, partial [Pyrobaculum sp.]
LLRVGDIETALRNAVQQVTEAYGPDTVGIIGVDARGNPACSYNTEAMARGWGKDGEIYVAL